MMPTSSRIALVVGRKGSGKSTLIKRGLERVARWVVWDLRGEYAALPRARLWTDLAAFRAHLVDGGGIDREVFACPASQFLPWCRWVYATGNLLVVIEELGRYAGPGPAGDALGDLFDRSRHAGIDLIAASPRIVEVPTSLRAQVDDLLCARQSIPNDLAYLDQWIGPALSSRVSNLPDHRFLRVKP